MKKNLNLFLAITLFSLLSCSSSKYYQFDETPDEIFTTDDLKNFLGVTENPKIVLRVNKATFNMDEDLTDTEKVSSVYDAIETTFLKNKFKVRDRQLFEQVVQSQGNSTDYSELSKQTDTDLIIELLKVDFDVNYSTNIVHCSDGKSKVDKKNYYSRRGSSIEFKVIQIKNNDYAGLYKINFTPCTTPCYIDKPKKVSKKDKGVSQGYTSVSETSTVITEFVRGATDKLIYNMRNGN